jgi:hypothetical protein
MTGDWGTPKQLPFYALMGELAFRWSRVETDLVLAAKRMLDLNMKEARIALRNPRPQEILEMIEEVGIIHNERVGEPDDLGDLYSKLEALERNRNLLIHAVWLFREGKHYIQNVGGKKKPPDGRITIQIRQASVKRKIFPGAIEIDEQWFKDRIAEAKDCLSRVGRLGITTRALGKARRAKKAELHEDRPRLDEE